MSVPDLVRDQLDGESVRAAVDLGGEDALIVTPSRTLVYRAEGLLSGESLDEFAHDADRLTVSEGRRKSTIRLEYGVAGAEEIAVPAESLSSVLEPLMAGVLAAAEITDADEAVRSLYRSGELTVIVADGHLVKHIGDAVWDAEAEVFAFADVTDIGLEEGEVSSQIIVEANGRPERIKIPSSDARRIKEQIESALLAFHEVESYDDFRAGVVPDEEESDAGGTGEQSAPPVDSVETNPPRPSADLDLIETGEDTNEPPADLDAELADIKEAVSRQNELLEAQQTTLERLIDELRRGR